MKFLINVLVVFVIVINMVMAANPTSVPSGQPSSMPTDLTENPDLAEGASTDLITAARSGSIAAVEAVLNNMGLEAATKNNFAFTSSVSAMFSGLNNVAEVVIDRTGLKIDTPGVTGNTMLMWASLWGNINMVETLLKKGADPLIKNKDGDSALSLASKKGHRDVVVKLRNYGAL